ncbi:Double Clp-N motif protein [Euphorbia peplus]|nr:Double Clp-N motif protein [Euphorbia peplus]
MAARTFSFLPISSLPNSQKSHLSSIFIPLTSFHGNQLQIREPNFTNLVFKSHASTVTPILSSLPTKKHASEKIPKWSARAIRSFGLGELEARKLKYPNTGTEALLMGILIEGTSPAAKFLRANGITFFKAQRALDKAVDEKLKSGDDGEISTGHIILGLWSEKESAGYKILETLGFNDEKAKELAESMNEDVVLSSK